MTLGNITLPAAFDGPRESAMSKADTSPHRPRQGPSGPAAEAAPIAGAALRMQAARGGLRFETYLPPALAEWLFDRIERGDFAEPSEAVVAILGEYRDLEPHADLREELLRRIVQAAIDDPRPALSFEEVERRMQELVNTPVPEPAVWRTDCQAD